MPDFRELCAELVQAMDKYPVKPKAHRDLCNRVRAAIEQAERQQPSKP
jgi:DNA-binding response OmpR family regulator